MYIKHIIRDNISNDILVNCLKYFNLYFDNNNLINESSIGYLCKYDYYILVKIILTEMNIDINTITIYTIKFHSILIWIRIIFMLIYLSKI